MFPAAEKANVPSSKGHKGSRLLGKVFGRFDLHHARTHPDSRVNGLSLVGQICVAGRAARTQSLNHEEARFVQPKNML
jgi:hypothetical protein